MKENMKTHHSSNWFNTASGGIASTKDENTIIPHPSIPSRGGEGKLKDLGRILRLPHPHEREGGGEGDIRIKSHLHTKTTKEVMVPP
jgi:hypothetical protein